MNKIKGEPAPRKSNVNAHQAISDKLFPSQKDDLLCHYLDLDR